MWISRIRVTGGFLNGLDVSLSKGLNVVVGPRGAGKTTFLELLRHAVGAQHAEQSPAAERSRQAFLDAVLGSGEVIVDVESDDGGLHLVVDAQGGGRRHDLSHLVLVLGQNELEEIASDAASRLNLLDLRTGSSTEIPDRDRAAGLSQEIFDLREELEDRREEALKRSRLKADRELLRSQEASLLGRNSALLSGERDRLRVAEELVMQTGQTLQRIETVSVDLDDLVESHVRHIDRLVRTAEKAASLLSSADVVDVLQRAVALSQDASSALAFARERLQDIAAATEQENITARGVAAPIRDELDQAEAGLGQITAQLRNIETALRNLDENDLAIGALEARRISLSERRAHELDQAERAEELLYETRAAVARATTSHIANNVVVAVDHLADSSDFRLFLQGAVRRSGIRTNVIDSVSERVLPRQLLEMIEYGDAKGLSAIAGIAVEQAHRLIENMDDRDVVHGLSRVRLTDSVDFRLRDGSVDKSVDELSTGQKCAVTLPIVLSEQKRTLILDQPEDHLDNAFLVTNIVTGLRARRGHGAQTIVATHNPNIPVLGSADNVVVLKSDGKSGSVDVQGPFDDGEIVDRVTRLMEGGREAFAHRSMFYAEHGGL